MKHCESCETVGIKSKATTKRNGEAVCADCARDIDSRKSRIGHFCDVCSVEVTGDYCPKHPDATVSSIQVIGV